MKKTLALALVAAMTISMASMTAFAKTTYNTTSSVKDPEEVVATVTLTKEDLEKISYQMKYKYTVVDKDKVNAVTPLGASYANGDVLTSDDLKTHFTETLTKLVNDGAVKEELDDSSVRVCFGDLDVKTLEESATRVVYGWAVAGTAHDAAESSGLDYWGTNDTEPTKGKKAALQASDVVTLTKDTNGNYVAYFDSLGKTLTDKDLVDAQVEKLQKGKEDAKKAADTKKDNDDKLQKLDEKYGANIKDDNTNGYVSANGKATKIRTNSVRKQKGPEDMNDFYWHSIKVAGAPDSDGDKTWVFDVSKTSGTSFGEGNTARVEFDLGFGDDADLTKFDWKVYHIEGWCKAERVKNVEVVGNKLYVWTDKFSPFVVTRGDINASAGAKDASNPSTGDFSAVPVALLAAAALGATGFVAYKKRKAE